MNRRLPRRFYARSPVELAPELLNKVLVTSVGRARIVEVEAYGGPDDPGSHAWRGQTPRTEVMFGPAGRLYVYLSYGMHWCANVVADATGTSGAVLLRAATPLAGHDAMYANRAKARRDQDLCSGPAKLCQALGLDGDDNGVDLVRAERAVTLLDDGAPPPARPDQGARVGLSRGTELPWRWAVPGSADVSRPRVWIGYSDVEGDMA